MEQYRNADNWASVKCISVEGRLESYLTQIIKKLNLIQNMISKLRLKKIRNKIKWGLTKQSILGLKTWVWGKIRAILSPPQIPPPRTPRHWVRTRIYYRQQKNFLLVAPEIKAHIREERYLLFMEPVIQVMKNDSVVRLQCSVHLRRKSSLSC